MIGTCAVSRGAQLILVISLDIIFGILLGIYMMPPSKAVCQRGYYLRTIFKNE